MLDPYTINLRIWEEAIELADAHNNPIYYEQLNRFAEAGDLDGVYELLKEMRVQL